MSRLQAFFTNPVQATSPVQPGSVVPQQGIAAQQFQQPQQTPGRNPVQKGPLTGLRPGQMVRFRYLLAKNDPRPLIIVSHLDTAKRLLKGVNLHYLTFPYIKRLLYSSGVNPSAANYNIKADPYIMDSFRSYSWPGVDPSSIEIFDTQFIVKMINMSRTMDPTALKSMRSTIDQQINARVPQQQAMPTAAMPMTPMPAQPVQQAMNIPTGNQ